MAISRRIRKVFERKGALMKRLYITQRGFVLLLVVSTFCPALNGCFRPQRHVIIQSEIKGPVSIYAADLDRDGDMDVLSASNGDRWTDWKTSKIAWYENK